MELELKKEQFACYQALPQLSENREETTKTIRPGLSAGHCPHRGCERVPFPAQP